MKILKSIGVIGVILVLSACGPKPFELSPSFKSKIQSNKKINVSLVRPDTHVIEIGLKETKEDKSASEKASKIFVTKFQKYFGQYFSVKHIKDDKCLVVEDRNTTNKKLECSALLKMFRKPLLKANAGEKYGYDISKLPPKYDVTVYLYATEPTRSAGEMTKDLVVGTTLMLLTGMAPVNAYSDMIRLVIVDNKTGEILWADFISGGSLDIDDDKEMEEQFSTLRTNFNKILSDKKLK